jgi:tetratricopeptide (TPR) repeat protein
MNERQAHSIMRRLSAAEGYLQLGMPAYALDEIDGIDEIGPFSPPRDLLRGEALKELERYDEAIEALQEAARTVAPPHRRMAFNSLIECFRARGEGELANVLEYATQTPGHWQVELPAGVQVQIVVQAVPTERGTNPFEETGETDDTTEGLDDPFQPDEWN